MLNEEAAEAMLKASLHNERNCLLSLEIDVSAASLSICQPTSFSITRLYAGNDLGFPQLVFFDGK